MADETPPVPLQVLPFTRKGMSGKDWTPMEMLERLLAQIRAGEVKADQMVITFAWFTGPTTIRNTTWRAGCSTAEEYWLLGIAAHKCVDEFADQP